MPDKLSFSGRVGGERGTPHGSPMGTPPADPHAVAAALTPNLPAAHKATLPLPDLTKEATNGE